MLNICLLITYSDTSCNGKTKTEQTNCRPRTTNSSMHFQYVVPNQCMTYCILQVTPSVGGNPQYSNCTAQVNTRDWILLSYPLQRDTIPFLLTILSHYLVKNWIKRGETGWTSKRNRLFYETTRRPQCASLSTDRSRVQRSIKIKYLFLLHCLTPHLSTDEDLQFNGNVYHTNTLYPYIHLLPTDLM
jgi:hypothetical protein